MKVRTVLEGREPAIFCIHPDETLFNCMKVLNDKRFGALLVLSEGEGSILGIISERDVMRITYERRGNIESLMVKEVMTPRKYMTFSSIEDDIVDVRANMLTHKVRHMPIVDYTNGETLVGFLSICDVLRCLLQNQDGNIEPCYKA